LKEKFWERFDLAWKTWAPEFYKLAQFSRYLGANYDDLNNWKQGRCLPAGGPAQLERVFARLVERGCNVRALAQYVYSGSGTMPTPPSSSRRFSNRGEIVRFDELVDKLGRLAQERAVDAAIRGEKIPEPYQDLVKAALDVRDLHLRTTRHVDVVAVSAAA